jgi:hypothetical protein
MTPIWGIGYRGRIWGHRQDPSAFLPDPWPEERRGPQRWSGAQWATKPTNLIGRTIVS